MCELFIFGLTFLPENSIGGWLLSEQEELSVVHCVASYADVCNCTCMKQNETELEMLSTQSRDAGRGWGQLIIYTQF